MNFLGGVSTVQGMAFGSALNSSDGAVLYDNSARELFFRTNGNVTRMTIDSSGNLGIGTTGPNAILHLETGGTSGYTGANRGALYTDNFGPRNVYEDTSRGTDLKIMAQRWEGGVFSFDTLTDTGSAFINQLVLAINPADEIVTTTGIFAGSGVTTVASNSTNGLGGIKESYRFTDGTLDRTLTISTAQIILGTPTQPWKFFVKDESGTLVANGTTITIDTEGAETIDGATSVDITADYGVIRLYSDGTNLFSW